MNGRPDSLVPPARQLRARGLSVHIARRGRSLPVTEAIDLDVGSGEAVAIVGESGSGKSLSARAVLDLLPTGLVATGELTYGDLDLMSLGVRERRRLRGREIALVMQDPFTMLNPVVRCGEQIVEALTDERGRSLPARTRREEAVRRLAEVGITDPAVAERYPAELSGGMLQRVAIAAAIAQEPRLLIADEPTTALDVTTQRQVLELLGALGRKNHMGIVLITHDLRVAFANCDRVYVMYAGTLVEVASSRALQERPLHPYTAALLSAEPPVNYRVGRLEGIEGNVPPPGERPPGCVFAPRCTWAEPQCTEEGAIVLQEVAAGHATACRRVDEIASELAALHGNHRAGKQAIATEASGAAKELVTVKKLYKTFPARRRGQTSTVAVDGVDLHVCEGEAVGIVGESGSGKSTIGRIIVGLEEATGGRVEVGGIELGDATTPRDRSALSGVAQMAFQDPYTSLNPAKTIGATLREAVRLADRTDARKHDEVEWLLKRVGLPVDYAKRRPAGLSGGERQRVAIARALGRQPRLLVCDEVVSALDVSVQAQILNLLRDLRDELGLAYLFITHDLAVVRQVTDRIYVLCRGVVVEEGPTSRVLDEPQHTYTRELIASIPASQTGAQTDDPRRNR